MKISRRKFFNKSLRFLAMPISAIIGIATVRNLDIPYPKAPPYFAKVGEGNWYGWQPYDCDTGKKLDRIAEIDCVKGYAHELQKDGSQRIILGNFKLVKIS